MLTPQLEHPLVSVVIPAYNAARFLPRTLLSILQQTYSWFEILVIDDGSTDETPILVQSFISQDSRITLLQQSNAGVAAARNRGIQAAKGEFIAPIDADDLWYPDAMAKMVTVFQGQTKKIGVVYAWSIDIDEFDRPLAGFHAAKIDGDVYKTLICHNFLGNASSSLIRKSCLERVGVYNTQLRTQKSQGCEDWDLYLRLAEEYEFRHVPKFLVGYRNIPGSMSGDFEQMARSQQSMLKTVANKHPDFPRFLYQLSYSSFYLYLAYQSDARGQAMDTLNWLQKSISTHSSALIRLGIYKLLLKNLLRLMRPYRAPPPQLPAYAFSPPKYSMISHPPLETDEILRQSPLKPINIQLKLFVSMMLHQFLLRL